MSVGQQLLITIMYMQFPSFTADERRATGIMHGADESSCMQLLPPVAGPEGTFSELLQAAIDLPGEHEPHRSILQAIAWHTRSSHNWAQPRLSLCSTANTPMPCTGGASGQEAAAMPMHGAPPAVAPAPPPHPALLPTSQRLAQQTRNGLAAELNVVVEGTSCHAFYTPQST